MKYGKKHHMQGKIKPDDANTEKQSLDLLFLSSPNSTCKILSREIVGKTQLAPRLHTRYNKQDKQSNLMP
jgi:hypothetical protein